MCNFSAIREYDFMKFIKYLLLMVFILGGLPVSQTGDLRAESASEQTKKKKRKKKEKKALVKNPPQVKKNPQVSLKRKKKEKEEEARRRSKIREN